MKTEAEIVHEIMLGEDSERQFKQKLNNAAQIAKEMCALSNSAGGVVYVGVDDKQNVTGLSTEEIRLYNQYISAAANEQIKPAIYPQTQVLEVKTKLVLIITVAIGASKAYCDKDGIYWVKSGSDTRHTSPQELARLFQQSGQLNLDEMTTSATVVVEEKGKQQWGIDLAKFYTFFESKFGQQVADTGLAVEKILVNMNLANEGKLTLAGLLLFGTRVQDVKPYCLIRAVSYLGNEISDTSFIDKRDCLGTLEEQFRGAILFLKNNLAHIQTEQSFNSTAALEIDELALEEAVVNALLHRDYSKNAVVRILIFKNRVEIISPGSLTNHLNVENIKSGNSIMRNPLLASFGTRVMPYSGLGSGVPRIVKNHPETELVNDVEGGQFKVIFKRRAKI